MSVPTIEEVSRRLDGLERENRVLRWIAAAVFVGAVVLAVEANIGRKPKPGVIEAEKIVIRDKEGRVHARFGVEGNSSSLTFLDRRGSEKVSLEVYSGEYAGLTFSDHGQPRLVLESESNGASALRMFDRDQKSLATMYVAPDSTTAMGFAFKGKGLAMGVQPDGNSAIFSVDKDGRENGRIGEASVTPDSLGMIRGPLLIPSQTTAVLPRAADAVGPPRPTPERARPRVEVGDRPGVGGVSN